MTLIDGVIMGIVQGLTEFLPVSSSGHLAAARHILGIGLAEDVGFEVAVHLGTLLAVIIFFWKRIIAIASETFTGKGTGRMWIWYIFIGTIPAGVLGIMVKDQIEVLFNSMLLVGVAWIATALLLYVCERVASSNISIEKMGVPRALVIGFAQALALIPGISRSGSTVAASLIVGLEKKNAVDFVFLLSLPAVGGAALLTVKDWLGGSVSVGGAHIAGAVAALISGYWAISVLLKVVARGKLIWFAAYCLAAGIVAVVTSL